MLDEEKSKSQLINELEELRRQLKETELYKYILDQIPVAMIFYDHTEKVVYRNKASVLNSGYNNEEVLGLPRKEYLNRLKIISNEKAKSASSIFSSGESFKEGIFDIAEATLLKKDGTEKTVLLNGSYIYNDLGEVLGACGCALDLTDYKKKEKMYHWLFETIPNPVFFKDAAGLYQGCNGAFGKLVGLPKVKILGRSVYDIWPRSVADKFKAMDDELFKKTGIQVYETAIPHADGTIRDVVFNKATYTVNGHSTVGGLVGIILDITESKRNEIMLFNALEESKQRTMELAALLKSTSAVSRQQSFKDTAQIILQTCMNLIGASVGYMRLLSNEVKQNEVLLLDTGTYKCAVDPSLPIPVRGLPEVVYDIGRALMENDFRNSEWVKNLPQGHVNLDNVLLTPLILDNNVMGMVGLGNKAGGFNDNDIKMTTVFAEHAAIALNNSLLLESAVSSEENYRTIFNAVNDAIILHDIENGDIADANKKAGDLYGYTCEELRSLKMTDIIANIPPYTLDNTMSLIRKAGQGEPQLFEWLCKSKLNHYFWVEVNLKSAVLQGGKYVLAVIRDISERKHIEKEMAHLDRLNLVGQMAAAIGHEVRNPMTTVRGFLQLFGNKPQFNDYKEHLDLMIDELDRANSIIKLFLSLAKNKHVEKRIINLNTILEILFPLIQADAFESGMQINLALEDIPDLLLDEKEIRQLILNLVRNGLEAMGKNQELTIRTYLAESKVVMSVADQGSGVCPEILNNLGTPFLTTKDEGTGLGLAVCYSIAARHNASIDVETSSGGTSFLVRFNLNNT